MTSFERVNGLVVLDSIEVSDNVSCVLVLNGKNRIVSNNNNDDFGHCLGFEIPVFRHKSES